jgi:hypothetical protein
MLCQYLGSVGTLVVEDRLYLYYYSYLIIVVEDGLS